MIARELFGDALGPHGFSCRLSRHCTFYRQIDEELYHVIMPDMGTRGAWYDVKVFPTAPCLQASFDTRFPDEIAVTTDLWSFLSEEGIGPTQEQFNCKYEDNLRRRFEKTVRPLLLEVAVPYLDRIRTMEDVIPLLRDDAFLGCALHYVDRHDEARPLLERERDRALQLDTTDETVADWLNHLNRLLAK